MKAVPQSAKSADPSERRRKLSNILHALAPHRWPRLAGDELRAARLDWTARLLGRPLTSSKELTEAELSRAVHALVRQVPEAIRRRWRGATFGLSRKSRVSSPKSQVPGRNLEPQASSLKSNIVPFPNRAGVSDEQLWKIRQIEAWLKWDSNPYRLEGFLESQFHARNPEQLTAAQAWRAIEALFHIAARVSGRPLAAVKEELRWWRPEAGQGETGKNERGPEDAA